MKKLENDDSVRAGMQIPKWLFEIYGQIAKVAMYQQKDANAEALVDWVTKIAAENSVARATLEEILRTNPEKQAKLKGLKVLMESRRVPSTKKAVASRKHGL